MPKYKFKGIKTTKGRPYDSQMIARLNDSLSYLPPRQRSYILGTIIEESQGNPLAVDKTGKFQGLMQWGPDRYKIKSKDKEKELSRQLQKIRQINDTTDKTNWTHGGSGSGYSSFRETYNDYNNPNIPFDQGYKAFSYGYVRPAGKEDSYSNRLKVVNQVYDRIKNDYIEPSYTHTEQPDATRVSRVVTAKPIHRKDDGGQLDTPKLWDDLSLSEKADVMEIAVRHGLRDLNEIRQAYNDFAENPLEDEADDNTFKNGGYVPSNSIKKRIANWEGSSMKTNRSFEDEARDFNRVIPEDIRKSLSQQQLDALYSYGYNVGMGNLKKRTLPVLRDYVNGHAGAKDVANGMWASKDNTLRGLRNRRDWERNSFIGNAPTGRQGSVVDDVLNMDLSYLAQQQPLFESNPTEYVTPEWMKTTDITLDNNPTMPEPPKEEPQPVNNGWGLLSLMSSLEEPEDMPFTGYEKPTNRFAMGVMDNDSFLDSSWFSDGGYLHGHRFDDGGVRYLSTDQFSINPTTGNIITDNIDDGVVVLPDVTVTPKKIADPLLINRDLVTTPNDATTVFRQPYYSFPSPELSPKATLRRADKVYSNYSDAVDSPIAPSQESFFNLLRSAKDNIWSGIPSRVSNCTLTATQWIDPNNPVKHAKSIVSNPAKYYYKKIPKNDISVGNLVIAKEPKKDIFHTMIISGFANKDGNYTFNGKSYNVKKGEPLVTYSSGGHDNSFLRKDIPLSVYTANSNGKTENLFYKYGLNDFQLQR